MDTYKIKYCNSNGFLVKNSRFRYDIVKDLNKKLGYNSLHIFEKSYSDRLLEVLKSKIIMSTYISFGKYTYMYFTKIYNENVCMIIELSNRDELFPKIIVIPCQMKDKIFENTLFYGEIYKNKDNSWFYLIESIILYQDKIVKDNILAKIKLMNMIVNEYYTHNLFCPLRLITKKYFNLNEIESSIDELDKNNIKLKGIKFYGLKNPICFYFNTKHYTSNEVNTKILPELDYNLADEIKKLNEEYDEEYSNVNQDDTKEFMYDQTYILELRKSINYGIYDIYCNRDDKIYKIGKAHIPNIELSNQIMFNKNNNFIVEGYYNYLFKKFTILSFMDKEFLLIPR